MPHSYDLERDLMNPETEDENKDNEVTITGECFDKTIPIENGDSVIFTSTKNDDVLLGKYIAAFDCVITNTGVRYNKNQIENWYHIPFNVIQEKLNTKAFNDAYNVLTCAAEEQGNVIEEYIANRIESLRSSLDDDREFLISLFTRNVRNEKIDFKNYKFMMDILFGTDSKYIEYDEDIDLRNLRNICYNMHSIMNKISKETYDEIYARLSSFADSDESLD